MAMFRNDETHLKKAALGALCLFLLWTLLSDRRVERATTPATNIPAKATPNATPETRKTLYNAMPGKWRRTLREVTQGRAVADMWSHRVWISPCRWSQRKTLRANSEEDSHQIFKCVGTKVEIVNEELRVNEKSYGKLSKGAEVWVGKGKVFVGDKEVQKEVQPLAQFAPP
jgi:hypothetical protein